MDDDSHRHNANTGLLISQALLVYGVMQLADDDSISFPDWVGRSLRATWLIAFASAGVVFWQFLGGDSMLGKLQNIVDPWILLFNVLFNLVLLVGVAGVFGLFGTIIVILFNAVVSAVTSPMDWENRFITLAWVAVFVSANALLLSSDFKSALAPDIAGNPGGVALVYTLSASLLTGLFGVLGTLVVVISMGFVSVLVRFYRWLGRLGV